jgi:hypothetical protein
MGFPRLSLQFLLLLLLVVVVVVVVVVFVVVVVVVVFVVVAFVSWNSSLGRSNWDPRTDPSYNMPVRITWAKEHYKGMFVKMHFCSFDFA